MEINTVEKVRDHNSDRNEKQKMYADCKGMHMKMTSSRYQGVTRKKRDNRLSTPFKQVPYTVVQYNGNSVLVESDSLQ